MIEKLVNFRSVHMLAGGWGWVLGEDGQYHLVYIPLWDPPKFNEVGRAIFATLVIKQHLSAVTNEKARELLTSSLKDYAASVGSGFSKAMDDGDDKGWCGTPYPRHWPGGGVVPGGGDPGDPPIYRKFLGEQLASQLEAKAGISMLGKMLNDKRIISAAEMI